MLTLAATVLFCVEYNVWHVVKSTVYLVETRKLLIYAKIAARHWQAPHLFTVIGLC